MKPNELVKSDFLSLKYDYIEYYVGMAKMVVYWHVKALGFKVIAYAGPENGTPDKCSYFLVKNSIRLVITSASQPASHDIVSFVDIHGNGIKRIAVQINNVNEFFQNAVENGAIPVKYPYVLSDSDGNVEIASVKIFDDNEILFIDYKNYKGLFIPGYKVLKDKWSFDIDESYFVEIDHIACALRFNETKIWEKYFNNIFNSKTVESFDGRSINSDDKIGMLLKILQTEGKQINNVLVEPDQNKQTQVQLFLDSNYGSGIQHVAFSSSNIFKTIETLKKNGVEFSSFPSAYYDKLQEIYPSLDVNNLRTHGVLCEVVGDSLLLQTFTAPLGDRPTFFYEIIQRVNNYEGFGINNIKALFNAVELEMNSDTI